MTVDIPQSARGPCAGNPEMGFHAPDPLVEIGHHLTAAWSAIRLHIRIVTDEAVSGFCRILFIAAMGIAALSSIVLLMSLGGFYLVSGVALGLTELAGSPWLGRSLAGLFFLVCPMMAGWMMAVQARCSRERRLVVEYRRLRAHGTTP